MQERAIKTRQKILETAVEYFAARGYHGATVDAIAEAAGVNKQRLYAYFKSKSGLFESSLVHVLGDMNLISASRLAEASAHPDRLTDILLREYMALYRRNPLFWRMLAWANLEEEASLSCIPGINDRHYRELSGIFDRAREIGAIPGDMSFEIYIFVLMSVSFFYHSNRKTLSKTLSGELFTQAGRERLIQQCVTLFH